MEAPAAISRYTQVQRGYGNGKAAAVAPAPTPAPSVAPQASQEPKPESDFISRAAELLAGLDELDETAEFARTRREKRQEEARCLAAQYATALGLNGHTKDGRDWIEKTITFYSANDSLLGRLKQIVLGVQEEMSASN